MIVAEQSDPLFEPFDALAHQTFPSLYWMVQWSREGDDALARAWRASSNAKLVAALASRTLARGDVVPMFARVFALVAQEHSHGDAFGAFVNAAVAWRPGDATEGLVAPAGVQSHPMRSYRALEMVAGWMRELCGFVCMDGPVVHDAVGTMCNALARAWLTGDGSMAGFEAGRERVAIAVRASVDRAPRLADAFPAFA